MADKEKVLSALELCDNGCADEGCVYLAECNKRGGFAVCRCIDLLTKDVLALLKEQEKDIEYLCEKYADLLDRMLEESGE